MKNLLYVLSILALFCQCKTAHTQQTQIPIALEFDKDTIGKNTEIHFLTTDVVGDVIAIASRESDNSIFIIKRPFGETKWTTEPPFATGKVHGFCLDTEGGVIVVGETGANGFIASSKNRKTVLNDLEKPVIKFNAVARIADSFVVGGQRNGTACLWFFGKNFEDHDKYQLLSGKHSAIQSLLIQNDKLWVVINRLDSCEFLTGELKNSFITQKDYSSDDAQATTLLKDKNGEPIIIGTQKTAKNGKQMFVWKPLSGSKLTLFGRAFTDEAAAACFDKAGQLWLAGLTTTTADGFNTAAPKYYLVNTAPNPPPQYGSDKMPNAIAALTFANNKLIMGGHKEDTAVLWETAIEQKLLPDTFQFYLKQNLQVTVKGLDSALTENCRKVLEIQIHNDNGSDSAFYLTAHLEALAVGKGLNYPKNIAIGWLPAQTTQSYFIPLSTELIITPFENRFHLTIQTADKTTIFDEDMIIPMHKIGSKPERVRHLYWHSADSTQHKLPPVVHVKENKLACKIQCDSMDLLDLAGSFLEIERVEKGKTLVSDAESKGSLEAIKFDTVKDYTFSNLQSGSNFFRLIYQTASKGASSELIEIIYDSLPKPVDSPNLHLVCIGIPYTDLNYTTKDAFDFHAMMKTQEGLHYKRVYSWLYNTAATTTKAALQQSLADLKTWIAAGNIGENDVFIFFDSSHGEPILTSAGGFSLAIPTSDTRYEDKKYLDFKEIKAVLNLVKCKKIILFDACYSANAKGVKSSNSAVQTATGKIIKEELEKVESTSPTEQITYRLASSQGSQESYEYMVKKNGYFTYFILQALKDRNEGKKQKGYLYFDELCKYVKETVSKNKTDQTPDYNESQSPFIFYKYPPQYETLKN